MIRQLNPFLTLALLLAFLGPAAGDTVYLKSGDKLIGQVRRRQSFLEVRTAAGIVKVSDHMVDKIEWDSGKVTQAEPTRTPLAKTQPGPDAAAAAQPNGARRVRFHSAMSRKISLDFDQTPVLDAIDFLRDMSGINIIVSPEATEAAAEAAITLKVADMDIKTALAWVLRLGRLHSSIRAGAIYVTDRPDPTLELRTYDVRDLMFSLRDNESQEFAMSGAGGGGAGGGAGGGLSGLGGGDDEEEYDMPQRAADLIKLIINICEPTSWGYAFVVGAGEDTIEFGDFF